MVTLSNGPMLARALIALVIALVPLATWAQSEQPASPIPAERATDPGGSEPPLGLLIANGVEDPHWPAAGALLFGDDPASADFRCSGTLIGCSIFLTAAHCMEDEHDPRPRYYNQDPKWYHVYLQNGGIFAVKPPVAWNKKEVKDFNLPRWDIAIFELVRPVEGIAPLPLNRGGTLPYGTKGTIVGFGKSEATKFNPGIKRRGTVTTGKCIQSKRGPTLSDTTEICWSFDKNIGIPGEDSSTCHGDSGGGLYVGDGHRVAGITSAGERDTYTDGCVPPDHVADANVFYYLSWIEASAKGKLGTKPCGAFQPVDIDRDTKNYSGRFKPLDAKKVQPIEVPSGTARLRVAMNGELSEDQTNNFDLFLIPGNSDDLKKAKCKGAGRGQFAFCEIPDPPAGPWTAVVRGTEGFGLYQLTVTFVRK